MPKFEIVEIDRDYRAMSGHEVREFASRKEADEWCKNESWTGYDYYVQREIPNAPS